MRARFILLAALSFAFFSQGCQSTYETDMRTLPQLVDSVNAAQDTQKAAQTQFVSAQDQLKSVVNSNGGPLKAMYDELKLNIQYSSCQSRAKAVHSKIDSVKHIGNLFLDELNESIVQTTDNPHFLDQEKSIYNKAHQDYDKMVAKMDQAAASMDLVLAHFHNLILSLRANSSAEAIASFKEKGNEIDSEIDQLVNNMNASVEEADQFLSRDGFYYDVT